MKKQSILLLLIVLAAMLAGCQKGPVSEPGSHPQVNVSSENNGPTSPSQAKIPDESTPSELPLPAEVPSETQDPVQINEPADLPLITADIVGLEGMDKTLFDGAVAFFGRQSKDPEKMTIPQIGIFGQYEADDKINVICQVALIHFCYNDAKTALMWDGSHLVYGRAVLTENDDGTYTCDDFALALDGATEAQDLKEFCGPLTDLPGEIYDGLGFTNAIPDLKDMEAKYTQATGITIS